MNISTSNKNPVTPIATTPIASGSAQPTTNGNTNDVPPNKKSRRET